MKKIYLGKYTISKENSVFIIAEIGVNHNGDVELAKKMIDAAVDVGADAVKFQTFKTKNVTIDNVELAEYQKKNLNYSKSQKEMIKNFEISYDKFLELKKYCDLKKIMFLSAPHSEDAIEFLNPIVPGFKIGSGDLTSHRFLRKVARTDKTIIISTGMANMNEIEEAIQVIRDEGNENIVIMHCTTNYPCPLDEVNLNAMKTIEDKFNLLVGYSDHTKGIDVSKLAVSMGAVMIEKHFTTDKNLPGPDQKTSLNPTEFKQMVQDIRSNNFDTNLDTEIVLGSGTKESSKEEIKISKIARKSLVAKKDIKKNETITNDMIAIKRPGTGIEPKYLDNLLGKKSNIDVKEDTLIPENIVEKKKIVYVTGSRADYGAVSNVLLSISKSPDMELHVIATGMHLMEKYGLTIEEISQNNITLHKANVVFDSDSPLSSPLFISNLLKELSSLFDKIKPNMILVLGDRPEMISAGICAKYLDIPLVHISGGDISGHVDNPIRHAISKLADIHFPISHKSAQNLINMGVSPERIFVCGATSLDNIKKINFPKKELIMEKYGLNPNKPYALVVQHPVLTENNNSKNHMITTLNALEKEELQSLIIFPNADSGGEAMIKVINKFTKNKHMHSEKSIPYTDFLALMKFCDFMIGNSSSGILESPSFGIPCINIGSRQEGRERANNIIDSDYDINSINKAIQKAIQKEFIEKCKNTKSPYDLGNSGKIISKVLSSINSKAPLKFKQFNDMIPENITFDYHIHTKQTDGQSTVEEIISKASQLGLKSIAITEHVNKKTKWFDKFSDKLHSLNSEIEVYIGIEAKVVDFDGNIDATERMKQNSDLVLGVVHRYPKKDGSLIPLDKVKNLGMLKASEIEFNLTMGILKNFNNGVQILGHPFGVYSKYFNVLPEEYFRRILIEAKKRGIIVEINTKYLFDNENYFNILREINPYVSIGSDAHSADEIARLFNIIKEELKK